MSVIVKTVQSWCFYDEQIGFIKDDLFLAGYATKVAIFKGDKKVAQSCNSNLSWLLTTTCMFN